MKKKDSFEGQKMIVLPEKIIKYLENSEITTDSYVTDIGYFPVARDHYRMREEGSMQNILISKLTSKNTILVTPVLKSVKLIFQPTNQISYSMSFS